MTLSKLDTVLVVATTLMENITNKWGWLKAIPLNNKTIVKENEKMDKVLRFNKEPKLTDFDGLSINGATFTKGKSKIVNGEIIVMEIPNTFRFSTNLEVVETDVGNWEMIMTQFITRGPQAWEMEDAFDQIGFRNPEIEEQMRELCNRLTEKGLANWAED